jgi:hypothetical protein
MLRQVTGRMKPCPTCRADLSAVAPQGRRRTTFLRRPAVGMRPNDGTAKPAWNAFVAEAAARGY